MGQRRGRGVRGRASRGPVMGGSSTAWTADEDPVNGPLPRPLVKWYGASSALSLSDEYVLGDEKGDGAWIRSSYGGVCGGP